MKENRTMIDSFNNAIEGVIYVLRTQRNMRWHFLVSFLVLFLSLFLDIGKEQFILLLFSISFVIVTELINTAIESTIDVTSTTFDPLAKIAKDVAAAAVLLSAINALVIGIFIFHDRLDKWTVSLVSHIRNLDISITIASLFIVLILVVAAKTFRAQHHFLKGGWVSGHSALAFSLYAIILFITKGQYLVAILGFMMALLVAQTRIESKIHRPREVLAGAIMGFLVTLLIFQLFYGRPLGS